MGGRGPMRASSAHSEAPADSHGQTPAETHGQTPPKAPLGGPEEASYRVLMLASSHVQKPVCIQWRTLACYHGLSLAETPRGRRPTMLVARR